MEIKIIFILLLLHYIGLFISKSKSKYTTLNCGIFAWAGKNVKDFNKAKFDIQGIYNDSRGGDSCGVASDGEVYYGITQKTKEYTDFLVNSDYEKPVTLPTIIGHTRKSSIGVVNEHNAHPFGFGNNEKINDCFEFVGCHNGTLYNHKELAKKFGVSDDIWKTDDKGISRTFVRNKIDSEILLECIYHNKNFNVLNEYIGGAAILFSNTREPNVIYAFHGASVMEKNETKPWGERPLYYYREAKHSLYISSMEESLVAIGGELNETIFEFEHNIVYKITNGDIDNADKILVTRRHAHQKPYTAPVNYTHNSNARVRQVAFEDKESYDSLEDYYNTLYGTYEGCQMPINFTKSPKKRNHKLSKVTNIHYEEISKAFPSPVFFQNLRYKRNGHPITGIYTFFEEFGLYELAYTLESVTEKRAGLVGKAFNTSTKYFTTDTENAKPEELIYPFSLTKNLDKVNVPVLYFYEGILLETEIDYVACIKKNKNFTLEELSQMSKHPICATKKTKNEKKQGIYKGGVLYNGNTSPLSSNKIYHIENGNLVRLETFEDESVVKQKKALCLLPAKPIKEQNDDKFIENLEHKKDNKVKLHVENFTDYENEDPIIHVNENENEIIKKMSKQMTPIYVALQNINNELKPHKDIRVVSEILDVNKEYLCTLTETVLEFDSK